MESGDMSHFQSREKVDRLAHRETSTTILLPQTVWIKGVLICGSVPIVVLPRLLKIHSAVNVERNYEHLLNNETTQINWLLHPLRNNQFFQGQGLWIQEFQL
jgi:hypothetical protein